MARLLTLTLLALAGLAAAAAAQYALPSVQMTARVSPAKASKSRSATVRLNATVSRAAHASPSAIALLLPRHVRLSTSGFPSGARIGTGVAAFAFAEDEPVARFDVRVLATRSRGALTLRFSEREGTRTAEVRAKVGRAGAPFGQKVTFAPPFAAPAHVTGLSLSLGATRRRRRALVARSCPGDRVHRVGIRLALPAGIAEARAQSACR